MNGRSHLLIALLALVGTAFAGCLEAPSFLFVSDDEVSAFENRALADEAALDWSADAQLVGVFGFEASNASDESGHDLPADPDVGNGRAVGWWYAYRAGNETRSWLVNGAGNVTLDDSGTTALEEYGDESTPLVGWEVDSDKALKAAKKNETVAAALAADDVFVAEGVAMIEGGATWYFAIAGEAGIVIATVNAATGELLEVHRMDFGFTMPRMGMMDMGSAPEVRIEDEGTLDGDEVVVEYPFEVASDGLMANLDLWMEKRLPTDGLWWAVQDASGETLENGRLGDDSLRSDEVEEEFVIPEAGAYKLVLSYHPYEPLALGEVEYEVLFTVGGWDMDFDVDWP